MKILKAIPAPVWYSAAALLAGYFVLRALKGRAGAAAAAVNPLNHDNVFAASLNAAAAALTDREGEESFGANLYNLFHEDEFLKSEREHQARIRER